MFVKLYFILLSHASFGLLNYMESNSDFIRFKLSLQIIKFNHKQLKAF